MARPRVRGNRTLTAVVDKKDVWSRMRRVLVRAGGLALGTLVGFFGSLNAVFSDGGSTERVNAILLTALVVGLVSALLGALDSRGSWTLALWVWAPGAVMLVAYVALGEYSAIGWAAFVMAVTFGAALAGAVLGGARVRAARG